ncbi:MAG: pyridoxal-phosphate dependent enzyme [Cyanobacteria bacterium HKST-UBA02]|nr:pyridoxal-phosphate dependent enzyme [Cyanobacteria bacterium HKST-UBA02]
MRSQQTKSEINTALILEPSRLGEALGKSVLVATESFQKTGSFKFRAALNVVLNSDSRHFAATSSGNFGQALAHACALEKRKCTLVMPDTSAKVKIEAARALGADVRLVDLSKRSRSEWLDLVVSELEAAGEAVEVVSPYDDRRVIEGNSSLVEDLLPYRDRFDTVICPVGGGGLSAGIARGKERHDLDFALWGAEPREGNDASRSLAEGRLIANQKEPATLADGARTLSLGKLNFEILKDSLAGIVEVEDKTLVKAVKMYFELANLKVEPTGALSLAALMERPELFTESRPLLIVSGGNVDAELYASLIT